MSAVYSESEIQSSIEICLRKQCLSNLSVNIVGTSEKGDGYAGDIVFANATGKTKDGSVERYSLALKCNKNKLLREISPISFFFKNEIHVYNEMIPAFVKFQQERGIKDPFNNLPKYYGSLVSDDKEIILLENLTNNGYSLWDKKKPMTRQHIRLVIEKYAKFHALSVAMKDQENEKFEKLTEPLKIFQKNLIKFGAKMINTFTNSIDETCDLLKNDLDKNILIKWRTFGEEMKTKFVEIILNCNGLIVVTHGDCWNNNFMFKTKDNCDDLPLEVSILDWQLSKLGSPVFDLSHFLFACTSGDDLKDLHLFLDEYYKLFSTFLKELKSNPEELYSKDQFLKDWRNFSKIGILMVPMVMKICTVEKGNIPDVAKATESGDFTKAFEFDVKNTGDLTKRIKPIVKYVVQEDLV